MTRIWSKKMPHGRAPLHTHRKTYFLAGSKLCMQDTTRRAVPHTRHRTSFRRDSHAGNARTAFETPYKFDDFLVNRGQTENTSIYCTLCVTRIALAKMIVSKTTHSSDMFSAQIAFTDSNQLGGDDLAGKLKVKVDPLPNSLSTQILPPCSSTNFLAKVNPSPVPSLL